MTILQMIMYGTPRNTILRKVERLFKRGEMPIETAKILHKYLTVWYR